MYSGFPKVGVGLIKITIDRDLFQCPVHPFHLAIRPQMIRLGQAMFHTLSATYPVKGSPQNTGSSSLQDGSCLTTATLLPKASPLDSKRAFGAALLTLSEMRKKWHEEGAKPHAPRHPMQKAPPPHHEERAKVVFADEKEAVNPATYPPVPQAAKRPPHWFELFRPHSPQS